MYGLRNDGLLTQKRLLYKCSGMNGKESPEFLSEKTVKEIEDLSLNLGRDHNDDSPLHGACVFGSIVVVEILIKHGADVNNKNYYGDTPLQFACNHGHLEVAEYLIRNGADSTAVQTIREYPGKTITIKEEFTVMFKRVQEELLEEEEKRMSVKPAKH